jgi:nitrogen-specific signal transduction histidine kinase/CheY-like chemotaxis protein
LIVWNNSFLWDSLGNITGVATIGTDITDKRHLEEQLHQSQKMEAIGTLAGGIAHDFNNILTVIMGYAYLIMAAEKDTNVKRMSEEIITSANRAEEMTKSLLSFSRKQTLELLPTDINDIVKGLGKSLPRLIREDIEFRVDLAHERLPVLADKWQIEQVIINLAVNARDAMQAGGLLSISTGEIEIAGEEVGLNTIITPGRYGLVVVADTGSGMDKKTRERIFEPFFTTKEVGKGTGLGLSMAYGAISKHDGYITVYSEPGQGTTFKIFLPIVEVQQRSNLNAGEESLPAGSETVLLVEDDEAIRCMTKQLLENYGYHVLVAVDGEDAVSIFRDNQESIQLILTDVVMPRKNGREAFEEICAIKPGVPAIFMSGYSADVMTHKGGFDDTVNYLSKPLKPATLLRAMRDLLTV